ncbi:MAG TPA: hypothetical protein VFY96_11645 [Candidatus Binatia bacterium]|nr:hypothetical protein [Candidatus Binatia bacterium]
MNQPSGVIRRWPFRCRRLFARVASLYRTRTPRDIFKEVFSLLRRDGCFINADNIRPPPESLKERYRRARDEYLDEFVPRSSGGKTNLAEVRAATPSSYRPHNNGYLEQELAWFKEAAFVDVDCFGSLPP